MNLIVTPQLIAIDTSVIGKISKDFYSKNPNHQKKSIEFIDKIVSQGLVPLFCFHHIAEILQHDNDKVVSNRLSLIKRFPQVAWVKSISQNLSIGSIIDVQGTEIEKVVKNPNISLKDLIQEIRNDTIKYSSGLDLIDIIEPECLAIRELNLIDKQRSKAVDSISHVRDPDIDKIKLSTLKSCRLKTNDEVRNSFRFLKNKYLTDLGERGDEKLEKPEVVVSAFLDSVLESSKVLYGQNSNSIYINFLNTFGVEEKNVDENWTIGDLGYYSIFKKKLEAISRSFKFDIDRVLQLPPSTFPSWYIWVELDKRIRKEKYAHGSNIIDKYLGSLCLYSDILVVDKRIKEYFTQIFRKKEKFSFLSEHIIKSRDYSKMNI